jgi:hypothetical protein
LAADEGRLRVIRPNLRRRTVTLVVQGSLDEIVWQAARGELQTGDLVVGLRPDRPVPAYEVAELRAHVPGLEEAAITRSLRSGLVLALLLLALFAITVALIPGAAAAIVASLEASAELLQSYLGGVLFVLWITFAAGRQYERWRSLRLARQALLVDAEATASVPSRT